jgi:hypothetical protein
MAPPMEQTTLAPWSQTWTNSSAGGSHDRAPGLETASGPGRGQAPDGDDTLAVRAVLASCRLSRLPHIDQHIAQITGEPAGATSTPTPGLAARTHQGARGHQEAGRPAPTAHGGVNPRRQQANKNTAATQDNPPKPNHHTLVGPRWYTPPSMTTPASPSAQTHDDQSNDPRWGATPSHRLARRTRVHIERVLGDNGSADRRLCGAIPAPIPQSPQTNPNPPAADPTPRSNASTPPRPTAAGQTLRQPQTPATGGDTSTDSPATTNDPHTHQRPNQPGRPVHAVSDLRP